LKLSLHDTERRDYHFAALLLAPFTLPFLGFFWLCYIIIRAILFSILFGLLLIIFPFCLILLRTTDLLEQLLGWYQKIGDTLLKANMYLLRLTGLFPSRA